MTRRYFGTDGIRGTVGQAPITADFMLKLGWAAGQVLRREKGGAPWANRTDIGEQIHDCCRHILKLAGNHIDISGEDGKGSGVIIRCRRCAMRDITRRTVTGVRCKDMRAQP